MQDCPDGAGHQLLCCAVPGYFYSDCGVFGADHGVNNDCRDHGTGLLLEASFYFSYLVIYSNLYQYLFAYSFVKGSCASGENHDCLGFSTLAECCTGHINGTLVGPTEECTWEVSTNKK